MIDWLLHRIPVPMLWPFAILAAIYLGITGWQEYDPEAR